MKYSVVVVPYHNDLYFKNFLFTAMNQDFKGKYEVIVVDNGTPNSGIFDACYNYSYVADNQSLCYMRIDPSEKKATNPTQGVNMGAREGVGEYLVVVADSNVLLSYNLLSEIDRIIKPNIFFTSSKCDVKISPEGTKESEYVELENKWEINCKLLRRLGWPKDPRLFNLDLVRHRYPPPHNKYDVYVFGMNRIKWIADGGYDETDNKWGLFHENTLMKFCRKYEWKILTNTRIVHQYHGLHKGKETGPGKYSKQFEVMRCRRT